MNELSEIIQYIRNKEWLLFLGAGFSKIAGCYDWNSVLEEMLDHEVIRRKVNIEDIKSQKLSNDELIDFCKEEFKRHGRENVYWGILRRIIHKDPEKYKSQYLPLLSKLKEIRPFSTIITTNIDNCLEESGMFDPERIFYEPNDFDTANLNPHAIFHIHGYIEKFKEAVLTRDSYIQRYRNTRFQDFLKEIFTQNTFLFLGYSLRDTELKDIIRQIDNKRKHFALVPEEDKYTPSEIAVFSELYKIKIIIYGQRKYFIKVLKNWISKNFGRLGVHGEALSND